MLLYHLPPWPRWRDDDVNAECWDMPPGHVARPARFPDRPQAVPPWFEDPTGHGILPASLRADNWKRAVSIEFGAPITVCSSDTSPHPYNLLTPNEHIMHSHVMRWVVSCLYNLTYLAALDPFPTEFESSEFIPTGGDTWKPWHHVYSMTKVGKGQIHRPLPNLYGKYIVRLFYLGSWRRITVDDFIPVDSEGKILLPCSDIPGELWPIILTKALLKVAYFTHGHFEEGSELSIVSNLTAWIPIILDFVYVTQVSDYIWKLCQVLLKEVKGDNELKPGVKRTTDSLTSGNNTAKEINVIFGKVTIVSAISEVTDHSLHGISPCPSHPVLIVATKILTYGEEKEGSEMPRWKQHRWKQWAVRTGLIGYAPIIHVKSARVLSAFKRLEQNKETELTSHITNANSLAVTESIIRAPLENKTKMRSKKTVHSKLSNKTSNNDEKYKDTAEMIGVWSDIQVLSVYMRIVYIYYRPSTFRYILQLPEANIKTTSSAALTVSKKSGKTQSLSSYTAIIRNSDFAGNVFYLFSDTIISKVLFLSVSVYSENHKQFRDLSGNTDKDVQEKNYQGPWYIVGQKYHWRHDLQTESLFVIDTQCMTSAIIQLEEGMQVLKVWTKLPVCFSIIVTSQSPFLVGSLQDVQEKMSSRSESLSHYASRISNAFENVSGDVMTQVTKENAINAFFQSYIPENLLEITEYTLDNTLIMFHEAFEHATVSYLMEILNDDQNVTAILSQIQEFLKRAAFGLKYVEQYRESRNMHENVLHRTVTENFMPTEKDNDQDSEQDSRSSKSLSSRTGTSQIINKTTGGKKNLSTSKLQIGLLFDNHATGEILKVMMKLYPDLLIHYPFRSDLGLEITFSDYTGNINLNEGQDWTLFLRHVVNIHKKHESFTSVTLSVPFKRYVYRIIDNDSNRDMVKTYSNTVQDIFYPNNCGYTVVAYAMVEHLEEKETTWRLRIMSSVNSDLIHSCSWKESGQCITQSPPALAMQEIHGYYIPNNRSIVFKALIHSTMKQVISIRVILSNQTALVRLSITSPDGTMVSNTESMGTLIIPVLWVDSSESNNSVHGNAYVVETSVVRGNWLLTDEEKIAVENLKEGINLDGTGKVNVQKQPRKKHGSNRKNVVVRAPWWHLQAIADVDKVGGLMLAHDRRAHEALSILKNTWEQEDSGRAFRALSIRQNFLSFVHADVHLSSLFEKYSVGVGGPVELLECSSVSQEAEMKRKMEHWEGRSQRYFRRLVELSREQSSRHESMTRFTNRLQQATRELLAERTSESL